MDFKHNPKTDFKDIKKLSEKEAKQEIESLREGIEYHNYLYYVKNNPEISDSKYDKLFKRLQELEQAFPKFKSESSPTMRVGAEPVDYLKKTDHVSPMLSLDSANEQQEIEDFNKRMVKNLDTDKPEYTIEPKFDGLSVEVVYEQGIFKYGATRGDGVTGEDISENLKTINTLPLRLRKEREKITFLAVRGEVYMSRKGFVELNKKRIQQGKDPLANPRNAAAGLMRQLDPRKVSGKPMNIVFYDVLGIDGKEFKSHWEMLKFLPGLGLRTSSYNEKTDSVEKIKKYRKKMSDKREDLDYEIDGIVVKLNDYGWRDKLGTRQRSPRWAIAWKFPPRAEITTLDDVVVQVGKTGMLTPVALLEPVEVGGVTVSRATLHNEDEARKKDVRPGDKVRVARAGDVIPEVVERIDKKKKNRPEKFNMPKKCPSCNSGVYREGSYYFCPSGLACKAQLVGRIIHYASRNALNIEGLGDETVKELVNRSMIKDMADLYKLTKDDFLKLEGFAEKSSAQLYKAIQDSKNPGFDKFLYALSIRHVGMHVARVIAREYENIDELRKADEQEIQSIKEIGPEIAKSIHMFFKQDINKKVLEKLNQAGVEPRPLAGKKSKKLEEKTFVFTGELENFTRIQAKEKVEELGGRAASSVSGNTDYVVVGDNPGSKLDQARQKKVKVIDEKEFIDLIRK